MSRAIAGAVQPGGAFEGTVPPGNGSPATSEVGTNTVGTSLGGLSGTKPAGPLTGAVTGGAVTGVVLRGTRLVRVTVVWAAVLDVVTAKGAAVVMAVVCVPSATICAVPSARICTASTRASTVVVVVVVVAVARVGDAAASGAGLRSKRIGGSVTGTGVRAAAVRGRMGAMAASASRITTPPATTIPTMRPRAIFMAEE